nr:ABC transporter permease [Candidatus Sigynarchaeota archaeon]
MASAIGIPSGIFLGTKRFRGKMFMVNFTNSFMGFPPVVMGLLVFLLLSRSGPLGPLGLIYTPASIIIAQTALSVPIIVGLTISAIAQQQARITETTIALGGSRYDVYENILSECRISILGGVIVAFGQAISEVGASMIVGGNIRYFTRTMTTAIVLKTSMGETEFALALGIILISTSFFLVFILTFIQMRARTTA